MPASEATAYVQQLLVQSSHGAHLATPGPGMMEPRLFTRSGVLGRRLYHSCDVTALPCGLPNNRGPASMERSCVGLSYRQKAYTVASRNHVPVSTTSKNVLHKSGLELRSQRVRHAGLVPRLIDEHAGTNHDFTSIDMIDTRAIHGSPCEYGSYHAVCNFRVHDWMRKHNIQVVGWSFSNRFRVSGASLERGQRISVRRVWGLIKVK
jgi:hypothetical protein